MAEKAKYPQIPSTVWWGVRSILINNPSARIDERFIGIQLNVQETAARQYISELKNVGLLNEDNKATELAKKWRLDNTYNEAVQEILETVYPEGLLQVAPPAGGERSKAVSWFLGEGLGQGAAGNKAATYFLIGSQNPNDAPAKSASARKADDTTKSKEPATRTGRKKPAQEPRPAGPDSPLGGRSPEGFPLNINIQIHISADAGQEQIESIFSAMRRYLHDK